MHTAIAMIGFVPFAWFIGFIIVMGLWVHFVESSETKEKEAETPIIDFIVGFTIGGAIGSQFHK